MYLPCLIVGWKIPRRPPASVKGRSNTWTSFPAFPCPTQVLITSENTLTVFSHEEKQSSPKGTSHLISGLLLSAVSGLGQGLLLMLCFLLETFVFHTQIG